MAVVPDFGSDENLVAGDAGIADALAHACFVSVDRGTVNEAVAKLERISGDAGSVFDLPEAEAELGDFVGVVEGEGLHGWGLWGGDRGGGVNPALTGALWCLVMWKAR